MSTLSTEASDVRARGYAREARAFAGRALGWITPSKGPVDLYAALRCAQHAQADATALVCELELLIDRQEHPS